MTCDHKPLFRRIIDAIHELQRQVATIHEQSAKATLTWPAAVSSTPRSGTAITPRHCIYAVHYPLTVGWRLRFGDEIREVTRCTPVIGDIGVAEWKEPISTPPMQILPWDFARWLPVHRDGVTLKTPLPVARCNQRLQVIRAAVTRLSDRVHLEARRDNPDFQPVQIGDSGCPIFLPLPQPVLLGCLQFHTGGPAVHHAWREVATWAPELKEAEWRP